ncbi:MAG: hypothetical protein Kow0068_00960 [Marinilabiliales bacterium]
MKHIRVFLGVFIILIFVSQAISQPTASFYSSDTTGCGQLTPVTFYSTSSGNIVSYYWDFGNGMISTDQVATIGYTSPGTYTVTLIVTDDGGLSDTLIMQDFIIVYANPHANFTYQPTGGCAPVTIDFYDNSTPGDGNITDWFWIFGDGNVGAGDTVSHTYVSTGTYNVTLEITDINGCTDDIQITSAVEVSEPPDIDISANPASYCSAPVDVQFTNNTTGNGTITYEWDFGDGGSSTDVNPIHTYQNTGVYDVTVIAVDGSGCSDTATFSGLINITEVIASFDVPNNGNFCVDESVQFTNTSGNPNVHWTFGNGAQSNLENPVVSYSSPGTYTVTLIAAYGDPCADTTTATVTVEEVIADFSLNPEFSCQSPVTVNYTATSYPNLASYDWHYGNGLTASGSTATTIYLSEGIYVDTLFVTSNNGCTAMHVDTMVVDLPEASFDADPENGCAPLDVVFTNTSLSGLPAGETGFTSEWTFPGGIPATSNQNNPPVVTFNNEGEYEVVLIVTTIPSGCVDTVTFEIQVGTPQNTQFMPSRDTICANDTLSFINLSSDTSLIDDWEWSFGSQDFEPTEVYGYPDLSSDTGYVAVSLISDYNGCKDTLEIDSAVYIQGPIIRGVSASMECDSPFVYVISADIVDAENWDWDFGDTTYAMGSVEDTIIHTYNYSGDYWIYCTAYNSTTGCEYKDSVEIKVRDVIADLQVADTACVNETVVFSGLNSQDGYQYSFNFGDGTITSYTISPIQNHSYSTFGTFNTELYVLAENGCYDTAYSSIFISEPVVGFYVDTLSGCAPLPVVFTDTSSSTTPLVSWEWDFQNNGTVDSYQSADTFVYNNAGVYSVSLTVTDSAGCSKEYVSNNLITVYDAYAAFYADDTKICKGDSVTFIPTPNNAYNYYWNFGNGLADTTNTALTQGASAVTVYDTAGVYPVQLIVEHTTTLCRDTMFLDSLIDVMEIQANFVLTNDTIACYNENLISPNDINNLTDPSNIAAWEWNFGDGTSPVYVQNPAHTYNLPGDYWIYLTAYSDTAYGCVDVDSAFIHLDGPYADFGIIDSVACLGESVQFSISNAYNLDTLLWIFGDGTSSPDSFPQHTYNNTGVYQYVLNVDPLHTCNIPSIQDSITIIKVTADFMIDDMSGCTPHYIQVTNNSQESPLGPGLYYWDFGDGSSSTDYLPPGHTYINNGSNDMTYIVQLIVEDSIYHCLDSMSKNVIVHPVPAIYLSPDTFICYGESVPLNVAGGAVAVWSPAEYLSNPVVTNPVSTPDSSIEYYVQITDIYGCTNTDSVTITVHQPPHVNISPDTTIIIGETAYLWVSSDQNNMSYTWAPNVAISCLQCTNPNVMPLETTEYAVFYEDSAGCFSDNLYVLVTVIEEYTLDVPTAFTPNGDGVNDVVYVKGWGIKELIEFKIFNRWGQQVFYTDDLKQGWDGTYKGKKQNMDTYAYYVKVRLWNNHEMEKQGTINLLR